MGFVLRQNCMSLSFAERFYSVSIFLLLTLCSIYVIFADSVIWLADLDSRTADVVMWVTVPLIMCVFVVEYVALCRLTSCRVLSCTACDFVYMLSIVSLVVELLRITPTMKQFDYYSLQEHHEYYHIDSLVYWQHKAYDAFVEFLIFVRIVHGVLRFVMFHIYGKEYRTTAANSAIAETAKHKNAKEQHRKQKQPQRRKSSDKHGYQWTAVGEPMEEDDEDDVPEHGEHDEHDTEDRSHSPQLRLATTDGESHHETRPQQHTQRVDTDSDAPNRKICKLNTMNSQASAASAASSSDETQDNEPVPQQFTAGRASLPVLAVRHSVELLPQNSDSEDTSPVHVDPLKKRFALNLNLAHVSSNHAQHSIVTPVKLLEDEEDDDELDDVDLDAVHIAFQKSRESLRDENCHPSDPTTAAAAAALEMNVEETPKLTLNQEMLSPPHLHIEPSENEMQSVELLDSNRARHAPKPRTATLVHIHSNGDQDEEHDDDGSDDQYEEIAQNWGIFPMYAAKLGIITSVCFVTMLLFDHPFLFMLRIVIFVLGFCCMMYVSGYSMVSYIRFFMRVTQATAAAAHQQHASTAQQTRALPPGDGDSREQQQRETMDPAQAGAFETNKRRQSSDLLLPITQPSLAKITSKDIQSLVFNPRLNALNAGDALLNPYAYQQQQQQQGADGDDDEEDETEALAAPKDIEFRTGSDEIKNIVRNMLHENVHGGGGRGGSHLNYASQQKLKLILRILQDANVMERGNIEENIEFDDELDEEAKRWLALTVLSKPDTADTPHARFDFTAVTAPSTIGGTANAAAGATVGGVSHPHTAITPFADISPHVQLSVSVSPMAKKLSALSPQRRRDVIIEEDKELVSNEQEHVHVVDEDEEQPDVAGRAVKNGDEVGEEGESAPFNVKRIIEDNACDMDALRESLFHISTDLDKLTSQILSLDGSLDTMELNRLTAAPLLHASVCIYLKFDFGAALHIEFDKFVAFIAQIEANYHDNPYHNRMHATEVMLASMVFIDCLDTEVRDMVSVAHIFGAFFAAIIHDVGHPGNNNNFEVNVGSPWALQYSDQSVLEFHHLCFAFTQLRQPQLNFTAKWDKHTLRMFRKQCVYSVLATDLTKHFDTITHIKTLKMVTSEQLEYVFKAVLKMADLSHVAKPLSQHKQWSMLITQEFHSQGDREAQHGLDISPLCNRSNTKLAKGQVGFIKHVVQPLYSAAQRFFGKESRFETVVMAQLSVNRKYWETEAKKEESVSLRTASLDDDMKSTPKAAASTVSSSSASKSHSKSKSSKSNRVPMKQRPMSATFAHHRTPSKFAILTNLDGTPPPMLPSSVRGIESMSTRSAQMFNSRMTTFFPPSNRTAAGAGSTTVVSRLKPRPPRASGLVVPLDKTATARAHGNIMLSDHLHGRPSKSFKRGRSSSANSAELPLMVPVTAAKALQLPFYEVSDEKSHSQNCLDAKLKQPAALAKLLSPRVIGEDADLSISPRSLLKLGGGTNDARQHKTRSNDRYMYMSLTPKFTKSSRIHAVNPKALSPKVQPPQFKSRPKSGHVKSARNIMRTKSSDGFCTKAVECDARTEKSVSILHALSPQARMSPFSQSHQKQVHEHKQEPSPDDGPRKFKFDVINEQK